MAVETNTDELFQRLIKQVNEHIETRWAYFTLTSTEKMSEVAANVAGAFTVFVFALLVLFFFSMGFAWWLGDYLGNRAGGFALAGLIFIPISILVYRWIRPFIRSKIIQTYLHHEDAAKTPDHE
jgi:hypothetical protein